MIERKFERTEQESWRKNDAFPDWIDAALAREEDGPVGFLKYLSDLAAAKESGVELVAWMTPDGTVAFNTAILSDVPDTDDVQLGARDRWFAVKFHVGLDVGRAMMAFDWMAFTKVCQRLGTLPTAVAKALGNPFAPGEAWAKLHGVAEVRILPDYIKHLADFSDERVAKDTGLSVPVVQALLEDLPGTMADITGNEDWRTESDPKVHEDLRKALANRSGTGDWRIFMRGCDAWAAHRIGGDAWTAFEAGKFTEWQAANAKTWDVWCAENESWVWRKQAEDAAGGPAKWEPPAPVVPTGPLNLPMDQIPDHC